MTAADDIGSWRPLRLDEVVEIFGPAKFRWWVSGGRALELHVGRSWRDHHDTDVGLARRDSPAIRDLLPDWDLHVAGAGQLRAWAGEPLDAGATENNLWCRPTPDDPWCLDVTIGDGNANEWTYRRDPTVRRRWSEAVPTTPAGIPYLAPELLLLFKSIRVRPKDAIDAREVIPALGEAGRAWLAEQLPTGHQWQQHLAAAR